MFWALTWKYENSKKQYQRWPASRYYEREKVLELLHSVLINGNPCEVLPDGTYRVHYLHHGCAWTTLYKVREVKR